MPSPANAGPERSLLDQNRVWIKNRDYDEICGQELSPPRREGWREATGWCGFWIRNHPSAPRSRRLCPSFAGGECSLLSPPRRGGVARSAGVVGFVDEGLMQ